MKVNYPVIVCVNNVRAIFMKPNQYTMASKTGHVDVKETFVTEYQENSVMKIVFMESKLNDADIMTKNLGSELHINHVERFFGNEYVFEEYTRS